MERVDGLLLLKKILYSFVKRIKPVEHNDFDILKNPNIKDVYIEIVKIPKTSIYENTIKMRKLGIGVKMYGFIKDNLFHITLENSLKSLYFKYKNTTKEKKAFDYISFWKKEVFHFRDKKDCEIYEYLSCRLYGFSYLVFNLDEVKIIE